MPLWSVFLFLFFGKNLIFGNGLASGVCDRIHTYTSIHPSIHPSIHTSIHTYIHMWSCGSGMQPYAYARAYTHDLAGMRTHARTHARAHTHKHTHTHTHRHAHTHTHLPVLGMLTLPCIYIYIYISIYVYIYLSIYVYIIRVQTNKKSTDCSLLSPNGSTGACACH